MITLLASIVRDGYRLVGLRCALNSLHEVRDSALSAVAYDAWDKARQITGDELYDLALWYGLHGADVPTEAVRWTS